MKRRLGSVTGPLKGLRPDKDCLSCHGTGVTYMMVSGRRQEIQCGCLYKGMKGSTPG